MPNYPDLFRPKWQPDQGHPSSHTHTHTLTHSHTFEKRKSRRSSVQKDMPKSVERERERGGKFDFGILKEGKGERSPEIATGKIRRRRRRR